jgi:hypothetical protein
MDSNTSLRLLAGLCALVLGRQLFWLFVGVVGFGLGVDLAAQVFRGSSGGVILGVALLGGIAGAALAVWMEEFMIAAVGFVAGGYIGAQLLTAVMLYPGRYIWFAMLIGGLGGTLLFTALFDWALIVVSSVVGASFIIQAVQGSIGSGRVGFIVLTVAGIVIQESLRRRRPPPKRQ